MWTENHGKGRMLRIGVRAYGFPILLVVRSGDKQLLSTTIGKDRWHDLRIPLQPAPAPVPDIVLEFVVPEKQRWAEGVFVDYVDFFQD